MPDRLRGRAALAALLILITIAGIRAVGPAVGRNLPAHAVVLAIGIVLEAALAGLLITLRRGHRDRRAAVDDDDDLGARLRRPLSRVLMTFLIAIPIAIAADNTTQTLHSNSRAPKLRPPSFRHAKTKPLRLGHAGPGLPDIFEYLLIAMLVVAAIAVAIVIWRRRPRPIGLSQADDEAAATPADLARAVESGRQALRELDDARAAIIRCYLAMERSLADAGAARGAAETPDELLGRAVANGLISTGPAGRLTALFYEARFSTHPMPPASRDEAEQALADLAADLAGEQRQPVAETSGTGA